MSKALLDCGFIWRHWQHFPLCRPSSLNTVKGHTEAFPSLSWSRHVTHYHYRTFWETPQSYLGLRWPWKSRVKILSLLFPLTMSKAISITEHPNSQLHKSGKFNECVTFRWCLVKKKLLNKPLLDMYFVIVSQNL